jgi:hypothetical protein
MKRLIIYSEYKHSDEHEDLNIYLDTELNETSKNILYDYLNNFLRENCYLTYVETGNEFKLTKREFDHMLSKTEYLFGRTDDTYLFPISIRTEIIEDKSISLKELVAKSQ